MPAKKFSRKLLNKLIGTSKRVSKRKRKSKRKIRRKLQSRSVSGKVTLPLDVSSPEDLPTFLKTLKSKNLTIILVYATWCPHCHTIMPHFDAASKNPNNTIASVKINETMLHDVNKSISQNVNKSAKPINVEGYPSILIVNKSGEKVTDINPVNDTSVLESVMKKAGTFAKNVSLTSQNRVNNKVTPSVPKGVLGIENKGLANKAYNSSLIELYNSNHPSNVNIPEANELPESPVDMIIPPDNDENTVTLKRQSVGGSLMSAMARTTYSLAPTAALLTTAAMIMKTKKTKKRKKR